MVSASHLSLRVRKTKHPAFPTPQPLIYRSFYNSLSINIYEAPIMCPIGESDGTQVNERMIGVASLWG